MFDISRLISQAASYDNRFGGISSSDTVDEGQQEKEPREARNTEDSQTATSPGDNIALSDELEDESFTADQNPGDSMGSDQSAESKTSVAQNGDNGSVRNLLDNLVAMKGFGGEIGKTAFVPDADQLRKANKRVREAEEKLRKAIISGDPQKIKQAEEEFKAAQVELTRAKGGSIMENKPAGERAKDMSGLPRDVQNDLRLLQDCLASLRKNYNQATFEYALRLAQNLASHGMKDNKNYLGYLSPLDQQYLGKMTGGDTQTKGMENMQNLLNLIEATLRNMPTGRSRR